ncbi:S8 family serine peptidase [Methylomonas sp. MED-D]|uniref:S8 family serine peptidase n=1 Tax=unclassified Methylomonas TaxID=2608980 RepID=UPI0028A3C747|nr:S8 family serine peptidase [Methylomonas sp. MV1]MDT4329164.1 S8 family serine peptidase [Methylomonas sp. MV1]
MPTIHFGSKNEPGFDLEAGDDLIAVRTRSGRSITQSRGAVPNPNSAQLNDGVLVAAYPDVGVEVYRVPPTRSLGDRKAALRAVPDVRFAGGVLIDPGTREPVLYTENLFVKFVDSADPDDCSALLTGLGLRIKEQVSYATNAYFVGAVEGTGQKVFDIADELLQRDDVEYCHPELIRPRTRKSIFPQQWHLKKTEVNGVGIDAHANVEAAHAVTLGDGVTIALIDDGVDIDHPEFSGTGKVVAPRDVTSKTGDPRPKDKGFPDDHGTACAGVACANGTLGASGVAPNARLMPIRLASGLGSIEEANAFKWAADHGADVISCSWGPADGEWWNLGDPAHQQITRLPASTKLAIDYAVTNGRGGKGCVILFAAGNGNESVDNDGYASYDKLMAVAACNDQGKRSVYSDFGNAVWCAFPSSDLGLAQLNHPEPLTPGIWTTDRLGQKGYNAGSVADGDNDGSFTNSFGGTSSACPGAAGVAALVLAVNPNLKWFEVKELFKRACDRIDPQQGNYDANGHSPKYGYGRLNALTAVNLAKPQPRNSVKVSRVFDAPIPDLRTVEFTLAVADNSPMEAIAVSVDIKHSYIGDLLVAVLPPAGTGVKPIVLHNRAGGAAKNLKKTYDRSTAPDLAKLLGKDCSGNWTLHIEDKAPRDIGTLVSFGIELVFAHPSRNLSASGPSSATSKPKRVNRAAKSS